MNFPSAQAVPDVLSMNFSYPPEILGADPAPTTENTLLK